MSDHNMVYCQKDDDVFCHAAMTNTRQRLIQRQRQKRQRLTMKVYKVDESV